MELLSSIIDRLHQKGVNFSISGQEIKFRAPQGALLPEEKSHLQAFKAELLLSLRAEQAAREFGLVDAEPRQSSSLTQESWWAWLQPAPNQRHNNRLVITKIFASSSVAEIEAIVRTIVDRHDALRTSFREDNGVLVASLNQTDAFTVELDERPGVHFHHSAAEELLIAADNFSADLPVNGKWLLKAKIVSLPGALLGLIVVLHHIICDANSVALLTAELNGERGTHNSLPFSEYAQTERNWFHRSGAVLIDYWMSWIKRQKFLANPGTGNRLEWQPGHNIDHVFDIPNSYHQKLRQIAAKSKSSPFLVYCTLYAISLSKWAKQDNFPLRCLGTTRNFPKCDSAIGNFITADPIEILISPRADFSATLKGVQCEYLGSLAKRLPGLLVFPAHPDRPGYENVRFSQAIAATINYIPEASEPLQNDDTETAVETWHPPVTKGDLVKWEIPLWPIYFRLWPTNSGPRGVFQFNNDIVTPHSQERLMEIFFRELESLVQSFDP